eukprot:TRINITY_DN15208_c0_g2_i1.p1 TRINITY_DN15208_c0_g2~~TRINITY_DN15208_c0_g2_i1.p1  ORF type:complete len:1092 (+),score=239.18 TRINITY_DN15208_c0_g2_i1:40-3315(+)
MESVWEAFDEVLGSGGEISKGDLKTSLLSIGLDAPTVAQLLSLLPGDEGNDIAYGNFLQLFNSEGPPKVYDLVVLGGGPVGVKAAMEAASRGKKVCLVESKACITGTPTGTHSKCMREAVLGKERTWAEVQALLKRVSRDAQTGTASLLRSFHVDIYRGSASFKDASTICCTPDKGGSPSDIQTFGVVIATGSRANRLPMVPFGLRGVYDSDTIQQINYVPKRMVVQGGGIVGLEYANMFAKLGSKVVVIEFFDKVLQMLDVDVQKAVLSGLRESGVEIRLSTSITSVKADDEGWLHVETSDRIFKCDCFLSATGRSGNIAGLGLENIGVKTGRGNMIQVDENQYTGVGNIYAAGDVAAANLATIGQAQAVRAVRKMFGSGQFTLKDKEVKPFVVWTIPEIAWVGLNESEAKGNNLDYQAVVVPYSRSARGIVNREEGFLKMLFDNTNGKVLGFHMSGDGSAELVNFGAEMVNDGFTIYDMLQYVFPAVTRHVLYNVAAADAKIRIGGVKNLSASLKWGRIRVAVQTFVAVSGEDMTFEEAIFAAFKTIDIDGSGTLEAQELQELMGKFGFNLSDAEVVEMMMEATGGGTHVTYEQFLNACQVSKVGVGAENCAPTETTRNSVKMMANVFEQCGQKYDLVVLGAGPAGIKAAVEAAGRGHRVALVDPNKHLTGTPTGTHSKCIREAILEGITDWEDIKDMIERVTADAAAVANHLLRTFQVDVLKGTGSFKDAETICHTSPNGSTVELNTTAVIIATGSRANRLPMIPSDVPGVVDSDSVQQLQYLPKRMVVQGGGIIGLEYANMFAKLGTEVVVIEFFDQVLQMLDVSLRGAVLDEIERSGVKLVLKTGIKTIQAAEGSTPERPQLRVDTGDHIYECDCFLTATGRSGVTSGLNLEAVGIKTGRGNMITTDKNHFTGVGKIYAVGDVAGGNLATVGQSQAVRAVRAMFGSGKYTLEDVAQKPFVVWTVPEIAWVGLTEKDALEKELDYDTVCTAFSKSVRGIVMGGHEGFLKLIYNKSGGKVLGVHICGDGSCELINFAAEIINQGQTIYDILQYVFPAVTLHCIYNIAAADAKHKCNAEGGDSWARLVS